MVDNGAELFSHDTIEGLANALEMGAATLKNTLENYNRAIEPGAAKSLTVPRTGKPKQLRAPFYGLRVVSGITFTMGGVAINGRAEVINQLDQPIAGLYAAGDAIGGLMGGFRGGYTGGLMQAVVTGILAGEHAASKK
jgi:fumarate reductase flavoprotein subunit